MSDELLLPGEDLAAWGVRTGRYRPERVGYWRDRLSAEQRRIEASGGDPAQSDIAREIRGLHPVLASAPSASLTVTRPMGMAAAPGSTTPHIDALERAVYGPTREQAWAEQDAALEASLAEQAEQDRIADSTPATAVDDVFDQLFPNG